MAIARTDNRKSLQIARREMGLKAAINRLHRYHLLTLDDVAYVTKDQAETNVLFELVSARYERRSMLITANQPFGQWVKILPDRAMSLAVVDRLMGHVAITEMNVDSHRRRHAAVAAKRTRGRRPAALATPTHTGAPEPLPTDAAQPTTRNAPLAR